MRSSTLRTPRLVGWLAVAGLVGSALIGPGAGAALANDLNQDPPISWDASGYGSNDCPALEPGEVFWHFIQNQVDDSIASGELTATFDVKGEVTVASYKKAGGALHWGIITGHDTLLDASSDVESDGNLNLSHICVGPDESEAPSSTPSEQPSETPSETPTATPTATPTGSVEAATGTPRITPPSTDTIPSTTTSSAGDGLRLALLGLAALISAGLVLTPSRKPARKTAKRD